MRRVPSSLLHCVVARWPVARAAKPLTKPSCSPPRASAGLDQQSGAAPTILLQQIAGNLCNGSSRSCKFTLPAPVCLATRLHESCTRVVAVCCDVVVQPPAQALCACNRIPSRNKGPVASVGRGNNCSRRADLGSALGRSCPSVAETDLVSLI